MHDAQSMQIIHSIDNLMKEPTRFLLRQPASHKSLLLLLGYVIKQLASSAILHHKEQIFRRLDDLIQLDEIRMPDQFEDMYLSGNTLDVRYIDYFLLFQHLNCYFLTRPLVDG